MSNLESLYLEIEENKNGALYFQHFDMRGGDDHAALYDPQDRTLFGRLL
jgi:hypothetical protein